MVMSKEYTYTVQVRGSKSSPYTVRSTAHKSLEAIWISQRPLFSMYSMVVITDDLTGESKGYAKAPVSESYKKKGLNDMFTKEHYQVMQEKLTKLQEILYI